MNEDSAIENFVESARAYCAWAEGPPSAPEREARVAIEFLVQLLGLALQLPERFGDEEAECISHSEWKKMHGRFGALPFNYYGQVFDPLTIPSEEPVVADLADDLADIWRDLLPGLKLFDAGHIDAAVWEWRNSFSTHWGHHATGGIHALHGWLVRVSENGVQPALQADGVVPPVK